MKPWHRRLAAAMAALASITASASSALLYSARGLQYAGTHVEPTRDGGAVVVGTQRVTRLGVVVMRLDPQGVPQWHRLIELPSGHLGGHRVRQTPDGFVVLAGVGLATDNLPDDLMVIDLDAAGQIRWQRRFQGAGTGGFIPRDLTALPDGGSAVSALDFGAGGQAWVARLAADGQVLWQQWPGLGDAAVQAAPDGGLLVAGGDTVMRLGAAGQPEWARQVVVGDLGSSVQSVRPLEDGGWLLAGGHVTGAWQSRAWVMRVSAGWEPLWVRAFAAPACGDETLAADARPGAGGILMTTYSGFCSDYSVLRLDSVGALQWQGTPDYADLDPVMRVLAYAPMPDGGYMATGTVADVDLPVRLLAVRTDAQGGVPRCRAVKMRDDRHAEGPPPAVSIGAGAASPVSSQVAHGDGTAGVRTPRLLQANACRL